MGRKNASNNFYQRLDPAGRLLIPKEYRDRLGSTEVWVVKSPPYLSIPHLRVMSSQAHTEYLNYLESVPEPSQTFADDLKLFIERWSRYRTFDELGRILLPREFIEFAEMVDEVGISGNSILYLWARHHFETSSHLLEVRLKSVSEEVQRILRWRI